MMGFWCKGKKDYCNDNSCESCNGCKHEDGSGGIELDDDDIDDVIIRQWISVKDGMPDDHMRVLSVQTDGVVRINMTNGGEFGWICNKNHEWVKTTHWMPLPEPPKEE